MAKKDCDICGGKIGLLGNRKLDDGNCCKDCANKLSPWMTGRRRTTVEDIKQHLAYREENKRKVAQFNPTSIAGENSWKVYVDPGMGAFAVSRSSNWRNENPDIIQLTQVISCEIEREEHQKEVYQQMADGTKKSYFPARYDYSYDFKVNIHVNSPWFNEIEFQLNPTTIPDRYDPRFRQYEAIGDQIRSMLLSGKGGMGMGAGVAVGMGMPGQFQQPMQQGQFQQPMQQGQFQQPMQQGQFQQPMQQGQFQQPTQQGQFQQPTQQGFQQQPMQQQAPAPTDNWFCQSCGAQNTGKFCQSCGAGR